MIFYLCPPLALRGKGAQQQKKQPEPEPEPEVQPDEQDLPREPKKFNMATFALWGGANPNLIKEPSPPPPEPEKKGAKKQQKENKLGWRSAKFGGKPEPEPEPQPQPQQQRKYGQKWGQPQQQQPVQQQSPQFKQNQWSNRQQQQQMQQQQQQQQQHGSKYRGFRQQGMSLAWCPQGSGKHHPVFEWLPKSAYHSNPPVLDNWRRVEFLTHSFMTRNSIIFSSHCV